MRSVSRTTCAAKWRGSGRAVLGIALLGQVTWSGLEGADPPASKAAIHAPSVDRVGFPNGYLTHFTVLRTVERDDGTKLVTVYGNAEAASVTNKSQLPYPMGAVIVMETVGTRLGGDGKPLRDGGGKVQRDQVLGMHVMRRGPNFGEAYLDKRSGEWEFAEYRADGSYITPPEKSDTCAACHIKAGRELDYVFKARLTP